VFYQNFCAIVRSKLSYPMVAYTSTLRSVISGVPVYQNFCAIVRSKLSYPTVAYTSTLRSVISGVPWFDSLSYVHK